MKRLLILILVVLLLAVSGYAQDDTNFKPDNDTDTFLLVLGAAFVCIIVGVAVVGSVAATVAMLALIGLVSAGILSAGILLGLYRKSITARFKTVVGITGSLTGILMGPITFYLINRIFQLHFSGLAVLAIGGFSGLVGGLLLGLVLFLLIRVFLNYCRARLSF